MREWQFVAVLVALSGAFAVGAPSEVWMEVHGVDPLALERDDDWDGVSNGLEGEFLTDPHDARSKPELSMEVGEVIRLGFGAPPNTRWVVEDSVDLLAWRSSPGRYELTADGTISFVFAGEKDREERYFRLRSGFIPDRDGDGLNDAEEALIGSNPFAPDTDGDGSEDGEEVAGSFESVVDGLPPDALFVTGSYPPHLSVTHDLSRVQLIFNREITPGDQVALAPKMSFIGPDFVTPSDDDVTHPVGDGLVLTPKVWTLEVTGPFAEGWYEIAGVRMGVLCEEAGALPDSNVWLGLNEVVWRPENWSLAGSPTITDVLVSSKLGPGPSLDYRGMVRSIRSDLPIRTQSLRVTSGRSDLRAGLTLTSQFGGGLTAEGSATTVTITELTGTDEDVLVASGGATIEVLSPLIGPREGRPIRLTVIGEGSEILVPELPAEEVDGADRFNLRAEDGARLNLAATGPIETGSFAITVKGRGSRVTVPQLRGAIGGTMKAEDGGELELPGFLKMSGNRFEALDAEIHLPALAELRDGTMIVGGSGRIHTPPLEGAEDLLIVVRNGAEWVLPGLRSFRKTDKFPVGMEIVGVGSRLVLPDLEELEIETEMPDGVGAQHQFILSAGGGAVLELPALREMRQSGRVGYRVQALGPQSRLLLPVSGTLSGKGEFHVSDGGAVEGFELSGTDGVTWKVAGGTIAMEKLVAVRNGGIDLTAETLTLPRLEALDGSQLNLQESSSLVLPNVSSADMASFVLADDSRLELGALREYRAGITHDWWSFWRIESGCVFALPSLSTLWGPDLADVHFRIMAFGGRIEMSQVETIHQPVNGTASTELRTVGVSSRILLNSLTTFGDRGSIEAAGPETFALDRLTQAGLTGITVEGIEIPD